MAFLNSISVVASGLTAQQLRMDVVSENITNSSTTRTESGGAYRRKMVVLESNSGAETFQQAMSRAAAGNLNGAVRKNIGGVHVAAIAEDPSDFKKVYDPSHPDADPNGYVDMPNVDMIKETADAMAATQAYSANVTAFNALKTVISKGLEIGK